MLNSHFIQTKVAYRGKSCLFVEDNFQMCSPFILTSQVLPLFSCSGLFFSGNQAVPSNLWIGLRGIVHFYLVLKQQLVLCSVLGIPGYLPMGLCS